MRLNEIIDLKRIGGRKKKLTQNSLGMESSGFGIALLSHSTPPSVLFQQ